MAKTFLPLSISPNQAMTILELMCREANLMTDTGPNQIATLSKSSDGNFDFLYRTMSRGMWSNMERYTVKIASDSDSTFLTLEGKLTAAKIFVTCILFNATVLSTCLLELLFLPNAKHYLYLVISVGIVLAGFVAWALNSTRFSECKKVLLRRLAK
jgi:hypothetical protein